MHKADSSLSAGLSESLIWKESSQPPDSSSSETGKDTPPETVHFTLGDGPDETTTTTSSPPAAAAAASPPPAAPVPQTSTALLPKGERQILPLVLDKSSPDDRPPSTTMVRSYSQEASLEAPTSASFLSKSSYSENSLGEAIGRVKKLQLRDLPPVISLDEEAGSTDSNSTTAGDSGEQKRRRRKLHFPGFRKSKSSKPAS